MKTNRTITLDEDVAWALKRERNASSLINSYLRHYFGLVEENNVENKGRSVEDDLKLPE